MAKISGHGGFVAVDATPDVYVHNASYEVDIESQIDDVTTSGSGGAAEGLPIIYKVNSCVIELVDDDAHASDIANALGLTEGSVVSLFFKRGSVAAYNKVTNTIVRSVRYSNPQTGARRVTITTEYGTFARGVSSPSF